MSDHKPDRVMEDEPEGGWVQSPRLYDSEVVSITLCKYTGMMLLAPEFDCMARSLRGHDDVDCAAVFVRAKIEGADILPGEVAEITVSSAGNDLTAQ